MTLPAFNTLDEIPEPFRAAYEERDGKWVPKSDLLGPQGAAAIDRMKGELSTAKSRARELEQQLAEAKRLQDAAKAGVSEDIIAKWNAEKAKEIDAITTEKRTLEQKLRALQLDEKVKAAALESGMFAKHAQLTLRALADRFDLDAQGGIIVKDEQGQPSAVTLKDFFAKHRADFPELYEAKTGSGGGASPTAGAPKDGAKVRVALTDTKGFLANLSSIAKGQAEVVTP